MAKVALPNPQRPLAVGGVTISPAATVVNGEVLMEGGKHTGALPGRVLRNTYYHANGA